MFLDSAEVDGQNIICIVAIISYTFLQISNFQVSIIVILYLFLSYLVAFFIGYLVAFTIRYNS